MTETQLPLPTEQPETATVDGAGLKQWCERKDVHVYRVVVKKPGEYLISLLWLDGRKLYAGIEKAI